MDNIIYMYITRPNKQNKCVSGNNVNKVVMFGLFF